MLLPFFLGAQPDKYQRFSAFGYTGVNLAQIEGDSYSGYNKIGARAGIGVNILWSPKIYTSLGFGFSQLGSQASRSEQSEDAGAAIDLRLNTVELPLLFHFRLGDTKATTRKTNYGLYRSGEIQIGVAVNRTTGRRVKELGIIELLTEKENYTAELENYENLDLQLLFGASLQFSLKSGLFLQYGRSLSGIYRYEGIDPDAVPTLQPYFLSVGYRHTVY
ncbi:outer membrane beta-barrel protein [Neolewinella persica]|uniref:outer membrane beta-barrel protein n=1 Tax=Neolewinella persica TaxID=70998 RepID=UPI00039A5A46|nr:outer membrane beta-barrel protein [Neolewinella persica]